jgi:hypothetical protein
MSLSKAKPNHIVMKAKTKWTPIHLNENNFTNVKEFLRTTCDKKFGEYVTTNVIEDIYQDYINIHGANILWVRNDIPPNIIFSIGYVTGMDVYRKKVN